MVVRKNIHIGAPHQRKDRLTRKKIAVRKIGAVRRGFGKAVCLNFIPIAHHRVAWGAHERQPESRLPKPIRLNFVDIHAQQRVRVAHFGVADDNPHE